MQSNPILNQINRGNNVIPQKQFQQTFPQQQQLPIQEIKNLMRQMRTFGNQQAMMDALLQQYPQLSGVFAIENKGASLQQIAEVMAQQKGVNLNNLINELQSGL